MHGSLMRINFVKTKVDNKSPTARNVNKTPVHTTSLNNQLNKIVLPSLLRSFRTLSYIKAWYRNQMKVEGVRETFHTYTSQLKGFRSDCDTMNWVRSKVRV